MTTPVLTSPSVPMVQTPAMTLVLRVALLAKRKPTTVTRAATTTNTAGPDSFDRNSMIRENE
jgi:hypothetical protein